jgi:drug/metabolite transporter (DMT)-like permease
MNTTLAAVLSVLTLLAILAVILVSRVRDEATEPSSPPRPAAPSGLGLALIAGVAIGLFSVAAAQISDGHAFGPLVVIRGAEAMLIAGAVVVTGAAWRPDRRLVPAISIVGLLDMTGNGAFILAVQAGALAVAAVLSSLYPVTTVVLAWLFLHERVTRTHAAGIALAMAAIACIAVGTT